jgi:hemerythrin-like domain-containing protein
VRFREREIKTTKKPSEAFIDSLVDVIRTYADENHHGKEEDILFSARYLQYLSIEHAIPRQ